MDDIKRNAQDNEGVLFIGILDDGRQVWYRGIRYFDHPCLLICDGNCEKAWGINNRPSAYNIDSEYTPMERGDTPDDDSFDEDDSCYLADGELGEAPVCSGIWEGGHGKPTEHQGRLNKWCCRECERSETLKYSEPIEVRDLSKRFYNCSPHVREETQSSNDVV